MSTEAVETIVAADPLIDLGCRLDWSKKGCSLIHPTRGIIPLSVRQAARVCRKSLDLS